MTLSAVLGLGYVTSQIVLVKIKDSVNCYSIHLFIHFSIAILSFKLIVNFLKYLINK